MPKCSRKGVNFLRPRGYMKHPRRSTHGEIVSSWQQKAIFSSSAFGLSRRTSTQRGETSASTLIIHTLPLQPKEFMKDLR